MISIMTRDNIIKKTEEYVKNELSGEASGHDWWHIYRVWKNAKHIGKTEKADMFVVELAALLHDIADWKFNDGDENAGARKARTWLESLNVDNEAINHVCQIIATSSYKGAKVKSKMKTVEGMIVQDADRLDAIGAIGIARTFAFGGHMNRLIYDPSVKPQLHDTAKAYKNNMSSTINHFYEKLLLLKDLMNTKSAKKIAESRHEFMEYYLKRFYKEWNGEV